MNDVFRDTLKAFKASLATGDNTKTRAELTKLQAMANTPTQRKLVQAAATMIK